MAIKSLLCHSNGNRNIILVIGTKPKLTLVYGKKNIDF